MKKIITFSAILFSGFCISWVHADCLYEELEPSCNILWETITSSCQGWSDTSSWSIPRAYQGECKETVSLDENTKEIISDYMYNLLSKKEYITSETDEYYRISSDWQEHIQNGLFHVIQLIISKEIEKPSPNFKKIAILNYFVSLVWYDYYMKK